MQQRRLRLGDILDDYCPRERRITNHVVVAMIDEEVKQTRCTTCDADHEYKQAKVPPARRKKPEPALGEGAEALLRRPSPDAESELETEPDAPPAVEAEHQPDEHASEDVAPLAAAVEIDADATTDEEPTPSEDEGPVHRRLIRATLPRPEGQVPERKVPDFTIRQPGRGGREFDGNKNGQRHGRRGGGMRFGGARQGGSGQGPRHGSGQGQRQGGGGNRGGHGRGGGGRKRGR
jgi:hypothetical protein